MRLPRRSFALAGVPVHLHTRHTQQVITVNTSGTHALVTFWRWSPSKGRWHKKMATSAGRVGYSGVIAGGRRHQGTGKTPVGTYPLLFSFGSHHRHAGWNMPYRHYGPSDYWVEDNGSRYYNRYRSRAQGGFRWWLDPNSVNGSERLGDSPTQYEMAVVIGYNYVDRVRYRGAGIFLHVNGHGATAGCVSAPRSFLAATLDRLGPKLHPVIAIGR